MSGDIVARLRSRIPPYYCGPTMREAADAIEARDTEIVRLRAAGDALNAIEALHQLDAEDAESLARMGVRSRWCAACEKPWPCPTNRLIHPKQARK